MQQMIRYAPLAAPILVAAGLIISEFTGGNAGAWTTVARPTVVAMGGAAVIEAAALLVFRRIPAAVTAATIAVLMLIGGDRVMILTGCVVLGWLLFTGLRALRGRPPTAYYHAAILPIAAITLLISTIQMTLSGALVIPGSFAEGAGEAGDPNIYVLILDAYARQDTLAEAGFDNEPFLAELEADGFDIYRDSRSSYNYTSTVLASMLQFRPISEIDGLPGPQSSWQAQSGALLRAINEAEALRVLEGRGYRTVSIPPVARHAALFNVDEELDSGMLTDFERHVLTDTSLAGILELVAPDWIAEQYRQRIRHAFEHVDAQSPGTFLWMHVLMPHFPFIFDADGGSRPLPSCLPGCPWTTSLQEVGTDGLALGYIPQLEYTNELVLAAVERVVAGDPGAVIVVMGDHGARHDANDVPETFRNLLAVRSPGHPRLLGPAPTSVNVLASIFNANFGSDLPMWPNDQFAGAGLDIKRTSPVR